MYGPKNKYLTLWQPIQEWMKGCDPQLWFENRWGGEQRKQPDHWPLSGLTILYKSSPRGEEADRDAAASGTVGRRRGWRCRWKSSRKGEVERRGALSRGKVIRLGEEVRVVGTEQKQKWWRRGGRGEGEVLYWCRRGEASVGSEMRGGGKKWGGESERKEKVQCGYGETSDIWKRWKWRNDSRIFYWDYVLFPPFAPHAPGIKLQPDKILMTQSDQAVQVSVCAGHTEVQPPSAWSNYTHPNKLTNSERAAHLSTRIHTDTCRLYSWLNNTKCSLSILIIS